VSAGTIRAVPVGAVFATPEDAKKVETKEGFLSVGTIRAVPVGAVFATPEDAKKVEAKEGFVSVGTIRAVPRHSEQVHKNEASAAAVEFRNTPEDGQQGQNPDGFVGGLGNNFDEGRHSVAGSKELEEANFQQTEKYAIEEQPYSEDNNNEKSAKTVKCDNWEDAIEDEETPNSPYPNGEAPCTTLSSSPNHHDNLKSKVQEQKQKLQPTRLVVLLIVLLAIIVAIVVPVLTMRGGDGASEEESDGKGTTLKPTPKAEVNTNLIPGLPESTWESIVEEKSPQRQAYEWIADDPKWDQYEKWRTTQRFALATFYFAMGGARWGSTKWLDYEMHECLWVADHHACHADGTIKLLNITKQRGFKGSTPPELALLTQLEGMDFSNNLLGELADLFGNAFAHPSLKDFWCSNCRLSGSFPLELTQLTNLRHLLLKENFITGQLPSEIGELSQLTHLELEGNQFSGPIPTTIGNLKELNMLVLRDNQFSVLPSEAGKLAKLGYLDVGANSIDYFPAEVGAMGQLQVLALDKNLLRGTIPPEIGSLTNLFHLNVFMNNISGSIPDELHSLINLNWLALGMNQFVGTIPSWLGQITNLNFVGLGSNTLTSTIPSELGLLLRLEILQVNSNDLSGSIPSELANIPSLKTIAAVHNQFTVQEVPEEFCVNPQIEIFTDWCEGSSCCSP